MANQRQIPIEAKEYNEWLANVKTGIRHCQIKAAISVNKDLLQMYWQLGHDIAIKQSEAKWGDGLIARLSRDLTAEFPEMKGWSERNLRSIRNWYSTYSQYFEIRKQVVSKLESSLSENETTTVNLEIANPKSTLETPIASNFFSVPWGHHVVIMQKCKDLDKAVFYIEQTVENNWSRSTLEWQIESQLYERKGKAITNFAHTLPLPQSDLAQQLTKDPYVIDLMGIRPEMTEREIESHLNSHILRYLLELGKGFTFYGSQIQVTAGNGDFYIDQLFYHVKLHCYVVVELKAGKFKPEHIGQLNFYVSAVDEQLKTEQDNPTIGLLICKDKDDVVAEYSLRNVATPIGVSSMRIYDDLMKEFKSSLPTVEDIENNLKDYNIE